MIYISHSQDTQLKAHAFAFSHQKQKLNLNSNQYLHHFHENIVSTYQHFIVEETNKEFSH